jgi:hypothetical protein
MNLLNFKNRNPLKGEELMNHTMDFYLDNGEWNPKYTKTEMIASAGYTDGEKVFYVEFYTELLSAKNFTPGIVAEDDKNQERIDDLIELYSEEAVAAFIELYGEDYLDNFEDAYVGEFDSEEDFAEGYTTDCYSLDLPAFVVVDWKMTWECNLRYDYSYENGHMFCDNF